MRSFVTSVMFCSYMHNKDIFTLDPHAYPLGETQRFVREQKAKGRFVVTIVDPGVSIKPHLPAYVEGKAAGIFLGAPPPHPRDEPYEGSVWPGPVHFVDFLHPDSTQYWMRQLEAFHSLVSYEGLWLDMCEPANMGIGHRGQRPDPYNHHDLLNFPPYAINNGGSELDIFLNTITMDARHVAGINHLAVHNVYGLSESLRTAEALELSRPGRRHFLLTRSTFPGSGRFTGHWLGDNRSDFLDMKHSIAGMMDFQLFGIPMVGADICGFLGTTDEELCARWMALGSFYPFARNHNAERPECISQEPYQWPKVAEVTRKYFGFRYSILTYWYTLARLAHETGRPMIRPMFFEFPQFKSLWANDEQFMLGSALLVAPVLQRGVSTVRVALPPGIWYDALDGSAFPLISRTLQTVEVHADTLCLPVFLRGGHILLRQTPELTIRDTQAHNFHLVVALDEMGKASGMVYFDDGLSSDPGDQYTKVLFEVACDIQHCSINISGHFGFQVAQIIQEASILAPESWNVKAINSDVHRGHALSAHVVGYRIILRGLALDLNQASKATLYFSPLGH